MDIPKGKILQNLIYKNTNQRDLMLTFLPPINEKYEKAPVYFIIPGGGWHNEERQSMIDFSLRSVEFLRNEGFAVVSIDYRVCIEGVCMREIITDCFDAARYISHFADKFLVDKEKLVLSGHSAGAHLALMLAYAPHDFFKGDYKFSDDFTVICVAAMSPPTILDDRTNNLRDMCDVFSGHYTKEEIEFTSPMTYVKSSCPPTLLCAGTSDYLVFAKSSEILHKKLVDNNVEADIILSICGGHSFEKVHSCIEPSISMNDIQSKIIEFALSHIDKKQYKENKK